MIPYDYEAKGAADFAAGLRDDKLYGNPEKHGEDYRRGWQQARRSADAAPLPQAPAKPTSTAPDRPVLRTTPQNEPKPTPADQLPLF